MRAWFLRPVKKLYAKANEVLGQFCCTVGVQMVALRIETVQTLVASQQAMCGFPALKGEKHETRQSVVDKIVAHIMQEVLSQGFVQSRLWPNSLAFVLVLSRGH